jgi:BTB/POZ domain
VLHAAFNNDFEEARTQTYRIENIRPGAFRILVRWLYSQKLSAPPTASSNDEKEIEKLEDLDLIQLWVVADRLLIRPLQNCIIKTLSTLWGWRKPRYPTIDWIPYAYENTILGSPLRKLAVDLAIWGLFNEDINEKNEEKFRQKLPPELLFDVYKVVSTAVQLTFKKPDPLKSEDRRAIIDEREELIRPGSDEPFLAGYKYSISRTMRSYFVPEGD